MTAMQNLFFFYFNLIPDLLMQEPFIEFTSILMGIFVAALFVTIFHGGRKS